ncbi:MAG: hypothetical protein F2657_02170 [Actinobacteria bacterium]|uniref:Unannotated protein n=1 Tax=freshwater metagenome TaxID=449393 RepID=A0A6J6MYK5_9ZZZZ|nr:hypothetical protein [Actinomycetota bacterium]
MLLNKLFCTPKNQVSTPRPECGVGFDSSARAMNRDTKENVSLVSFERKQMLNTLKRKIALVAVSAVGLSGLALMSAPAANAVVLGLTSMTNQPTRNSSLAGNGLFKFSSATDATTLTDNQVVVSLIGTSDSTQASNVVAGETVNVRAIIVTAPTAAAIDSTTSIAAGDTLAAVGYLKSGVASSFTLATKNDSVTASSKGLNIANFVDEKSVHSKAFRTAGTYTVDIWVDATSGDAKIALGLNAGDGQSIGEPVLRATITIGGVPTAMALSGTSGSAAGASPGAFSLTLKDVNGVATLLQTFRNESMTVRTTTTALSTETLTVRRGTALAFDNGLDPEDSVTVQSRSPGFGTTSLATLPAGQAIVVVGNNESITASTGAYNYRVNHTGAMASTIGFNFAQTTGGLTSLAADLNYTFSTVAGASASKVQVSNTSGVHQESTTALTAATNKFQVYTAPTSLDTATIASYRVNPGVTTVGVKITGTAGAVVNVTVTASTTAGVTAGTTQTTLDATGVSTVNFTATTASGTYTISIPTAASAASIGSASVLTFNYQTAGNSVVALGKNGISTDLLSSTVTSTVVKVGATTAVKVTVKDQYGTAIPFMSVKGALSTGSRNASATMATQYTGADGTATVSLTDVSTSTTNMTDVLTINVAAPGTDVVTANLISGNTLTITYSATGAYSTLTLTGGTTATVTQTRQMESVTGSAVALVEVGITPALLDSAALAVSGVGIVYTGSDGVYFRATSGTRPTGGDVKTITKGSTTQIFAYGTKPGVATITATGGGLTATATFTVSAAIAGTARSLSAAAAAGRVTATVTDGWGNPVAGVTVSFASDNKGIFGNGTSSTSAVTDASGLASSLVQSADGTGADVSVISTISGGQTASLATDDVLDFAAGVKTVTTVAKPTAGSAGTDTAITGVKTDVTAVKADVATANAAVKALATQVTVLQASVATLIDSLTTQIAALLQSVSALTKAVAKLQAATKKK